VASQTCDQCGSIVASDEQFCPSCGAFMDPMSTPRPRPRRTTSSGNVISVSSDGSFEEFSLESKPPDSQATKARPENASQGGDGDGGITCPSCGGVNPPNNRHCQECGARLRQGPLPTAPRPAVQATAGVRAALAISGLLFGVVLFALLFNVFTGEDPEVITSSTTTSTTAPDVAELGPIDILDQICTPQGIGSFTCANLTSGSAQEYQVSWVELGEDAKVTIQLTFFEPIAIAEIQWRNIEDATRFGQNFRAKGITITAQDSLTPFPVQLADQQGTQRVVYSALNTAELTITIESIYQAEVLEGNVYDELAIDEITVIGRPTTPTTSATTPTTEPASDS